ncbi:MAG: hypothetical protein ITG00_05890 [Flavobacterium sp.]|nr:hypothetical protein [Flavobacterium sp.]
MKKPLYIIASLMLTITASAQVQTTSSTISDTLPTAPPADRIAVPATGHRIDAAQRRSASEVNAEMESKQKTQARANKKPNPHDRPLTEPASPRASGSTATPPPVTP